MCSTAPDPHAALAEIAALVSALPRLSARVLRMRVMAVVRSVDSNKRSMDDE